MKKEYGGNSKKSGIYQIRNLKNGKIYIGSAKCFQVRSSQHQKRLNAGNHHNKHLLSSWKNKKHSLETKLKLSKKVYQIDINNNLLTEFTSLSKASKSTKIDISSIVKCCKNQRKSAGGFVWRYKVATTTNPAYLEKL